jgi:hypothetical protein
VIPPPPTGKHLASSPVVIPPPPTGKHLA